MKALLVALLAAGTLSAGSIVNTKHDLSSTSTSGGVKVNTTQVCVFCHAPHNAAVAASAVIPLWNKTTTASVFTMYNQANVANNSLTGTVDATPTGASMACFTCHDGTLAVGALITVPYDLRSPATLTYTGTVVAPANGVDATGKIIGINKLGTNLTQDHPISITYNETLDTGLKAATTLAGVKLFPSNVTGSKVQCASCHQVHDSTITPFLRVTPAGSAICLACHLK